MRWCGENLYLEMCAVLMYVVFSVLCLRKDRDRARAAGNKRTGNRSGTLRVRGQPDKGSTTTSPMKSPKKTVEEEPEMSEAEKLLLSLQG